MVMAAIFTKKVQCLSLSKLCRSSLVVSRSTSSTVTAVDYDDQTSGSSSSNESTAEHRRHVPRLRRLQEIATAKQTRNHADTIIRDRGIALLRNPHTNKVGKTTQCVRRQKPMTKPTETSRISVVRDVADRFLGSL